MMKNVASLVMMMLLVLSVIIGCSKETSEKPAAEVKKKTEEVSVNQNVTEEDKDPEEQEQDAKLYTAQPLEVTKVEKNLYENEKGTVQFKGFSENEDGSFVIVLKFDGELTNIDNSDMQLKVIMNDSNSFILDKDDRTEIRKTGDEELHIYQTEEPVNGRSIIRVDISLFNDIDGNFNEENMNIVELEETTETVSIEGMEFFEQRESENVLVRENDEMKITLDYVEPTDISFDSIHLSGSIEYKVDTEEMPYFTLLQPDMGISETKELRTNHSGDSFYKNTKIDFSENISLGYPLGKESLNVIYFAIGKELFSIDLNTGDELSEANITIFEQEYGEYLDRKTVEGFTDVNGMRVYDAIQHTNGFFNYGIGTDNLITYEYVVGGFKTLNFNIGAAQNESKTDQVYDVYVYGDDFETIEGQEQPNGEPLYSKQVTSKTPLEEVSVDISGVKKATIYIDTNVPSGADDEEERFIPIIIGNIKVQR